MNDFIIGLLVSISGFGILLSLLNLYLIIKVWSETRPLTDMIGRLTRVEHYIHTINNNLQLIGLEAQNPNPTGSLFRTSDGKYEASTLEELMIKIATDPDSPINGDDIEELKRIFEKLTNEDDQENPDENGWAS